ncbi:MAG: pantoate--beta-alanine ligase [Methylococcales symbiont of Hymedesmia sp. n. MRB-2018]|nr:MAG: pantoate--beta-alanine ligase [Methylococcales symbiont of Hymedesmia sp. n. MRB-2018]
MQTINTIERLRDCIKQWRLQSNSIAFVPTMGNLHAGHIKLVKEARKKADKVVVSIFVNPTQFMEGEDFNTYPRTEERDKQKLKAAAADLLFLPAVDEVYNSNTNTVVSVSELSKLHCGSSRPGHFDGVTTIVTKLFNIVQADLSLFGKKDYQQLLIIQTLIQDLNIPMQIIAVETEREADGLAISSRNVYLSEQERLIAAELYSALGHAKDAVLARKQTLSAIEQIQINALQALGFKVDYFSICRSQDMQTATDKDEDLVIIVAAKLGKPRLIDNICFSRVMLSS